MVGVVKKCPACRRTFRKGERAIVAGVPRIVCAACARGAVRVVTQYGGRCACGSEAEMCGRCADEGDAKKRLVEIEPFAKRFGRVVKPARLAWWCFVQLCRFDDWSRS